MTQGTTGAESPSVLLHPSLPPVTLVLGGARSGKSVFAEAMIERAGGGVYLATAQALDDEMSDRIALHRDRRGVLWQTVEEPFALAPALTKAAGSGRPILVDCLTLWLTNLMLNDFDCAVEADRLAEALPRLGVPVVLISNEVGLGIVPDNALARRFRDEAGRLNQRVAALADRVWLIAAGLPLSLK